MLEPVKQAHVRQIQTEIGFPIIVFGDTTGFTRFLLRTIENQNVIRAFLLDLYEEFFRYQAETDCQLKMECDGFIAIHNTVGQRDVDKAVVVLEACERLQSRIDEKIKKVPWPRPDGFRIRVAGGRSSMDMNVYVDGSPDCRVMDCVARSFRDTIGYSGVLADRMLGIQKMVPLMCCAAIYEMASNAMPDFEFTKVVGENRVPDGVFIEDIQNLYAFKRKPENQEAPK